MEMQTDNPTLPYSDPTATPDAGVSSEALALSGATSAGDVSRVRQILSALNGEIELPSSPAEYLKRARFRSAMNDLQVASKAGNVDEVRRVIQEWTADPSLDNPTFDDLAMPLILAAQNAKPQAVRFLLEYGVPVSKTAVKLAARNKQGSVEVFQAFLDYGWDMHSFDRIPELQLATVSLPLTRWLLDHEADPNCISSDGHTPLDFCVTYETADTPAIIDLLLEHGAILSKSNALHNALITLDLDEYCIKIMALLLDKGFDVNRLSFIDQPELSQRTQSTALHWAVKKHCARRQRKNMLTRVAWLLDHGADVGVQDSNGKTPVQYATREDMTEILNRR